jgi:hypothetical protein
MCNDTKQRGARYGRNLYEIRVVDPANAKWPDKHYYYADSITVREGTLMLSAEVDECDDEAGESAIALPPIAIFAPGQWLSVVMVERETHEPAFSEETLARILSEVGNAGDEDDDGEPSQN